MNFWRINKKELVAHIAIIIMFALIAFVINKFPAGKLVAQGDYFQGIYNVDNADNYLFTWFNTSGQGSYNPLIVSYPYYALLGLLETVGATPNVLANILLFLFLTFSYLSFYAAFRIFCRMLDMEGKTAAFGGAMFYALNIYSFEILTYSYGYLHHFLIYIFLPVLFGVFFANLLEDNIKYYAAYALIFLGASVAFNNIVFLISLLFFQAVFSVLFFITSGDNNILKRFFSLAILSVLLSTYFSVPQILAQFDYIDKIGNTQSFGGSAIGLVINTSNSLVNVLDFNTQQYHFPGINIYSNSIIGNILPTMFGVLPFILIAAMFLFRRTDSISKRGWAAVLALSAALLFYIVLVVRIAPPFESVSSLLFRIPGFLLFRSPDKFFVIYNFLTVFLAAVALWHIKNKWWQIGATIALLLAAFPFYIGGVAAYLDHGFERDLMTPKKDGYKALVSIPEPYLSVRQIINKDSEQSAVISLPYSVVNSLNWSNYPGWNFVGHDFLYLLYNKNYVTANTYDHPQYETKLSFKEFNDKSGDVEALLALIQKFSGRFVIYHKDIEPGWLDRSWYVQSALSELVGRGYLKSESTNDFFDLYSVADRYFVPLIHLSGNGDSFVEFKKISPVKYNLHLHLAADDTIIFNQSFNRWWNIYAADNFVCIGGTEQKNYGGRECRDSEKSFGWRDVVFAFRQSVLGDEHKLADEYANSWHLTTDNVAKIPGARVSGRGVDVDLTLFFLPQAYFVFGLMVAVAIAIFAAAHLLILSRRRRQDKQI
jgi:hypothetical protein